MGAKWTAEQKAKFKATMAARRAAKETKNPEYAGRMEDAAGYLRQAVRVQEQLLREGKIKRRDAAHLLAELALKTLEGEL
jgi:phage FluMu gp28-like protein